MEGLRCTDCVSISKDTWASVIVEAGAHAPASYPLPHLFINGCRNALRHLRYLVPVPINHYCGNISIINIRCQKDDQWSYWTEFTRCEVINGQMKRLLTGRYGSNENEINLSFRINCKSSFEMWVKWDFTEYKNPPNYALSQSHHWLDRSWIVVPITEKYVNSSCKKQENKQQYTEWSIQTDIYWSCLTHLLSGEYLIKFIYLHL